MFLTEALPLRRSDGDVPPALDAEPGAAVAVSDRGDAHSVLDVSVADVEAGPGGAVRDGSVRDLLRALRDGGVHSAVLVGGLTGRLGLGVVEREDEGVDLRLRDGVVRDGTHLIHPFEARASCQSDFGIEVESWWMSPTIL